MLPPSRYTRSGASLAGEPLAGLVDARKVLDLFDAGATVVLQGLHRYWPPLRDLIARLELELGHPCQANAYLTPPGSQGFAVHSDSHDVFVFQTHGTKLWEIHGEDGAEEVLLEPGLSMYLPTGTPHAARAQDGASLHVTLGINQLTWRDLLRRSVEQTLREVPDDHLPAGYLVHPADLSAGLTARLRSLADAIASLDPDAAIDREVERFLTSRGALLAGGLGDLLAARDLADDTRLRRRAGKPMVLRPDGDRIAILLGDRTLAVPGWLGPALAHVLETTELTPADLAPDLDEQSRLVLCRRLVREGLLEVAR